jgi:hypothetical protein
MAIGRPRVGYVGVRTAPWQRLADVFPQLPELAAGIVEQLDVVVRVGAEAGDEPLGVG